MYRKLNKREKQWIAGLLNIEFQGRDILVKQFSRALVLCEQEYAYISLKFKIEGKVEPYPFRVRVPIEMRAFQQASAPIVFLLHVVNGVVNELEIITADSTRIDLNDIELNRVEYEINPEVCI